jgi:hypothetical protein
MLAYGVAFVQCALQSFARFVCNILTGKTGAPFYNGYYAVFDVL